MPRPKKTIKKIQPDVDDYKDDDFVDEQTYKYIKTLKAKKTSDPMKLYHETMEWIEQFKESDDEGEKKQPPKIIKGMPWVERFRPRNLDDIISHRQTVATLKEFIKKKQLPHLLLYGPPGTGKTSIVMACAREIYGSNYSLMVLEINASEERGIETVRNKIKDFIMTKGVFLDKDTSAYKLVILDEADAMTPDAQAMLRSVIERHTINVRFCIICNFIKKINPAIQSRCTTFKFSPLASADISNRLREICTEMNVKITVDGIDTIVKIARGDMRKVVNILQSTSMVYPVVNSINVATCIGYPATDDMNNIFDFLISGNVSTAYEKINSIITENGYGLIDIVTELTDMTTKMFLEGINEMDQHKFSLIVTRLKDIEINLTLCPNDGIQLAGIIGLFKLAYTSK